MKVSETYNLLTRYPEVAKSIDFDATMKAWEQNLKKYAHVTCLEDCSKIAPKTRKRAIFKCLKNPEHDNWDVTISNRTSLGRGCPRCAGRMASKENNLLVCYPEVAKSIDFDATIKAWEKEPKKYVYVTCLEDCLKITPLNGKWAIFKCLKNPKHNNWSTQIGCRAVGCGCPRCAGRMASKENNLLSCYPEVAKSIDFDATTKAWEKNPKKYVHVTCLEDCFKITPKTDKRAIFKCWKNPEHNNWDAIIGNRTLLRQDCPQCAGKVTSKENNLLVCYPEVAKSIDFDATTKAWEKNPKKYVHVTCLEDCFKITPVSGKRAIFKCLKNPKHDSWDAIISNRTKKGYSCPQCASRVASKENNILICYPEVAKSIDFDATIKSWEKEPKKYIHITCLEDCYKITPKCNKRAIFKCLDNPKHNNWDTKIGNRTVGCGCPQCAVNNCVSQEEKSFKNELVKILQLKDDEYKTNVRIIHNFQKNVKAKLELDFVCEKLGIAVEFNGEYWHSDKVIKKMKGVSADFYHRYKFEQAKKLGLTLLFVQEQDWRNNKKTMLTAIKNYCFKHVEIPEILQLPITLV